MTDKTGGNDDDFNVFHSLTRLLTKETLCLLLSLPSLALSC